MEKPQDQLFILLYTIAMLSGVVALVRFHTLYSTKKIPLYLSYLHFLYSYSVMVLSALGVVYVDANIQKHPDAMLVFQGGVLCSSHLLALTLPAFLRASCQKTGKKNRATLFLLLLFCCNLILFYFSPNSATLAGLGLFFTYFITALFHLFHSPQ